MGFIKKDYRYKAPKGIEGYGSYFQKTDNNLRAVQDFRKVKKNYMPTVNVSALFSWMNMPSKKTSLIGVAVLVLGGGTYALLPHLKSMMEKEKTSQATTAFVANKEVVVPVVQQTMELNDVTVPEEDSLSKEKPVLLLAEAKTMLDSAEVAMEFAKTKLDSVKAVRMKEYLKGLKVTRVATPADSFTARTMAYVDAEQFFKDSLAETFSSYRSQMDVSAANHVLEARTIVKDPRKEISKILKTISY